MQLGICCSPLRHQFAARLAERLERNLGVTTVTVAEGSAPVAATWEEASATDAVLLLLDSTSAPGPIKRDDWQSLLEHTGSPPVATLRFGDCHYPKLLERNRFFAPASELDAERWVECWLVDLMQELTALPLPDSGLRGGIARRVPPTPPSPPEWWSQAVDQPGLLTLTAAEIDAVQTFASEAGAHFQEVFWIGCQCLPRDVLAGEIEFRSAAGTRFLFVLVDAGAGAGAGITIPGPARHSCLILEGPSPPPAASDDPLAPWVGACQASGFPAIIVDLMLGCGNGSVNDWESLVIPLSANRGWFRPRRPLGANPETRARHLQVLQDAFRTWRSQPALCRELVGEAACALHCASAFPAELCLDLALFLLQENRQAEAVAWLRILAAAPDSESEFVQSARQELSWLVDEAGALRPRPAVQGDQLDFGFPEFLVSAQAIEESELLAAAAAAAGAGAAAGQPGRVGLGSSGRQLPIDFSA